MSVTKYKAGKAYKLRDECVNDFAFTSAIRSELNLPAGKSTFTFVPTSVHGGYAYVGKIVVANDYERSMFDEVVTESVNVADAPTSEPGFKKYAPFKTGAEYKLRKQYVDEFLHSFYTEEKYGKNVFTFKVSFVNSEGGAFVTDDNGDHYIARADERHMFKRIDNK